MSVFGLFGTLLRCGSGGGMASRQTTFVFFFVDVVVVVVQAEEFAFFFDGGEGRDHAVGGAVGSVGVIVGDGSSEGYASSASVGLLLGFVVVLIAVGHGVVCQRWMDG